MYWASPAINHTNACLMSSLPGNHPEGQKRRSLPESDKFTQRQAETGCGPNKGHGCHKIKPLPSKLKMRGSFILSDSVQFSSLARSCPTLCDPRNRRKTGCPAYHQLPEFTQTQVHRVGDAIQPSHPLSSPFPPAPIPPSIRVFSNESTLRIRWPKYWSFSFSMSPSNERPQDGLVGSPCSPRDSQESSPTPQFKSINFSVLRFPYSPTHIHT